MPPRGVKQGDEASSPVRAHQGRASVERGATRSRAEEIAARTVNKERARVGRVRARARARRPTTCRLRRRGGLRSGTNRPKGRTRDQLYNEARKFNIDGRSKMSKAQLQRAVDARK